MPSPSPGPDPARAPTPAERIAREQAFTRDASHELRTPLTVIRMASDLIAHDDGLSEASRRSLARLREAVAGMEATIDALLLLARGQDVPLEAEDFHLGELLEQVLEQVRPQLQRKRLALAFEQQADPLLHAPPRAMAVVLDNLLENAVRYTDAGQVRVRVLPDRVEIEDTGVGMDAATLARAFEPFYRGLGTPPGGGGLGLSVAHRLAQRCGWTLRLDSTPGQGTCASLLFGRAAQD